MNKTNSNKKVFWIDIATPKCAVMFSRFIPVIKDRGHEVLITLRTSEGYEEPEEILKIMGIDYHSVGYYGGQNIADKFVARIERSKGFVELFSEVGYPDAHISLTSIDGITTAFGLGIPVFYFADTPLRAYEFDYKHIIPQAKLTIPLATLIFHPFVIPTEIFQLMGVAPERTITYDFFDVVLWMWNLDYSDKDDFRVKYRLDRTKKTVLIREEEYKAHYVHEYLPVIYETIERIQDELDANIVVLPRYETAELKERFGDKVLVLEEKLHPKEFFPFIDLMIGGGGTMNIEAISLGVPVISTRSFLLYHDKYLIDNNLMWHTTDTDEVIKLAKELINKKTEPKQYMAKGDIDLEGMIKLMEDYC